MSLRTPLAAVLVMAASGALLFVFFHRQLALPAFEVFPEMIATLKQYREDLRLLRDLDPESRELYRRHFDHAQRLLERLEILQLSRESIERLYERLLAAVFGGTLLVVGWAYAVRHGRFERRLERLRGALEDLVRGRTDLSLGEKGRDVIGRVAAMIETTSQVIARDRRRLAALKNLSTWQEAARRHAHEMRTPLTGARLELERMREELSGEGTLGEAGREACLGTVASVEQEIDRLARFTRHFTSFARLPEPKMVRQNLGALVGELISTYAGAWPNLTLAAPEAEAAGEVMVDRDMLRQVLVNLCDNSSLALGERLGTVRFRIAAGPGGVHLDVVDDGPGVDPAVRDRLFEPYSTTRSIGEGMGLGLAISKKILLDHGGDLELIEGVGAGAGFRLIFPSTP